MRQRSFVLLFAATLSAVANGALLRLRLADVLAPAKGM